MNHSFPVGVISGNDLSTERVMRVSFKDLFLNVSLISPTPGSISVNSDNFYYNRIELLDGERPEQLSYRLYGSTKYYWTFFLINDHLRFGEQLQWAMSQRHLEVILNGIGKFRVLTIYNPNGEDDDLNLAKHFDINERIEGLTSFSSGNIVAIRPDFGQIFVKHEETEDYLHGLNFLVGETIRGENKGHEVPVGRVETIQNAIYKYYDVEQGREINNPNFMKPADSQRNIGISYITFKQNLEIINDDLRSIQVLKKESVSAFEEGIKTLLKRQAQKTRIVRTL